MLAPACSPLLTRPLTMPPATHVSDAHRAEAGTHLGYGGLQPGLRPVHA
jgi:hypothetical protein